MSAMWTAFFALALISLVAAVGTYGLMRQAGVTRKQMRTHAEASDETQLAFERLPATHGPLVCPAGNTCDNAGCLDFGCGRADRIWASLQPAVM